MSTDIGIAAPAPAIPIPAEFAQLGDRLRSAAPFDPAVSDLVDRAVAAWSRPGFDTLLSTTSLAFTPFDYQLSAARTVLRRMRGRAILADEVGLGKTIEAGLVISELRTRGLADRTLVICPTGLVEQWREELERKFHLPTVTAKAGWSRPPPGADTPIVVASLSVARRSPLKDELTIEPWDVVIADEAHRMRRSATASGRLARALRSRYLLLLTATPVENRLGDLYELVSLVAPGLLGTKAQFRRAHGVSFDSIATPSNVETLRRRTAEVMVRHRRSEVALQLPQRLAETVPVPPSDAEAEFYRTLIHAVRTDAAAQRLTLRNLLRLAGSTPAATVPTLRRLGWHGLADAASALPTSTKVDELVSRLVRHAGAGEKVLVFTGFRRTLDMLTAAADDAGIHAAVYHGSLDRAAKEKAVEAFRGPADVLLSTESAGEGRNLQFCHVMINADLPWNPMQIEQRVGRIHRIGQEHDVMLTNLVSAGTVEQRILRVLESKINLFELVVGELDMILGRVDENFDFESAVFDALVGSSDDAGFDDALGALGDRVTQARRDYFDTRGAVDGLIGTTDDRGEGEV